MGMAAPIYYTADMVRALPDDGNKYEVVYGELLVSPAARWWHQEVVWRLARSLEAYIDTAGLPLKMVGLPGDISWGSDTLVQPDVFVVPLAQARTLDWARATDLRLVAEVLSPSTARHDRFTKRRLYQTQHIPLYWVVEARERPEAALEAGFVELWTPDAHFPAIERTRIEWHPAGAPAPFALSLAELFRPL
jgi:Uma2 family endonuclease